MSKTHRNVGKTTSNDKTSSNIDTKAYQYIHLSFPIKKKIYIYIDTKAVLLKKTMCMIKFMIFDDNIICTNKNYEF